MLAGDSPDSPLPTYSPVSLPLPAPRHYWLPGCLEGKNRQDHMTWTAWTWLPWPLWDGISPLGMGSSESWTSHSHGASSWLIADSSEAPSMGESFPNHRAWDLINLIWATDHNGSSALWCRFAIPSGGYHPAGYDSWILQQLRRLPGRMGTDGDTEQAKDRVWHWGQAW